MARKTGSKSEITGPRIREAALSLFAQQGYAAVSMRQIARAVGVQAGALYLYTSDKQSLLFDLMRDHMDGLLAASAAEPKAATPLDRLQQFTRFHILYHLERPDAVFVSYMELRNLNPENFAAIEGLRRQYEQTLEAILKDGLAEGVFRLPDTKLATLALIAMLTGVNTWYRQGGRLGPDKIASIYWDMVRKAVAA
ncbi:MAG: TetR/AcrR family transcriptional regulator [Rhodobacteraceae bacterium]|nr:TetR/AcrR family transcriptional regulator [Paracoccaceae bacterium]